MATTWEQRQKAEPPRYTVHVNVLETVGGGDSKQTRKIIEFSLSGPDLELLISKGVNVLELSRPELSDEVVDGTGFVVKRVAR